MTVVAPRSRASAAEAGLAVVATSMPRTFAHHWMAKVPTPPAPACPSSGTEPGWRWVVGGCVCVWGGGQMGMRERVMARHSTQSQHTVTAHGHITTGTAEGQPGGCEARTHLDKNLLTLERSRVSVFRIFIVVVLLFFSGGGIFFGDGGGRWCMSEEAGYAARRGQCAHCFQCVRFEASSVFFGKIGL